MIDLRETMMMTKRRKMSAADKSEEAFLATKFKGELLQCGRSMKQEPAAKVHHGQTGANGRGGGGTFGHREPVQRDAKKYSVQLRSPSTDFCSCRTMTLTSSLIKHVHDINRQQSMKDCAPSNECNSDSCKSEKILSEERLIMKNHDAQNKSSTNNRKIRERTRRKRRTVKWHHNAYPYLPKILQQSTLVLLLIFFNGLGLNQVAVPLAQATSAHSSNNKLIMFNNNDDESSTGKGYSDSNTRNQTPIDDASDNFTQIPFEYNNNGNSAPSQASTTLTTTTSTPALVAKRSGNSNASEKKPLLKITEAELLPFSDFNVQQPAFTDLIRTWPPTTLQNGAHSSSSLDHLQSSRRHARQQQKNKHQHHHSNGQKPSTLFQTDDELSEEERVMRNHLNEDLDDTIVTADQKFELDQLPEPPTWINYLGDLGDYIYIQLRQYSEKTYSTIIATNNQRDDLTSTQDKNQEQQNQRKPFNNQQHQLKIEAIDEILDDYYYDQYENSQVLYYGAQLVREGDIFEIGCYLPYDQQAEWTKSGRPLRTNKSSSPRIIRRGDFLGAKQNFSLKIFEASLTDSGNYRCNKMSRKYHKLVVVPKKTSMAQLYMIQQRLLSVVNPQLMSQTPPSAFGLPPINPYSTPNANRVQRFHSATTLNQIRLHHNHTQKSRDTSYILPGYLIVENEPLIVNCNITDELVLRRLRENPKFQLAWFKNGKQLKGPMQQQQLSNNQNYDSVMLNKQQTTQNPQQQFGRRSSYAQPTTNSIQTSTGRHSSAAQSGYGNQRIQFLQPNGRQLYITSAMFSDAGEYLCSWTNLPSSRFQSIDENGDGDESASGNDFYSSGNGSSSNTNEEINPIAAGSLVQLLAPVKLRPFKSTYHVRKGNQLRLVCQAQRGYPSAHISWYVGNRLVDNEFLKQHLNEYRVLHLQNQNQLTVTSSPSSSSSSTNEVGEDGGKRKAVEINPVPSTRQQMQMTANGRGQWIEYRDLKNEKYAIDSHEQQLRYLQAKLAQLNGHSSFRTSSSPDSTTATSATSSLHSDPTQGLWSQSSISVLTINSLNIERHTSRYACRATTRANTDEVTTVIRVEESSTVPVSPSSGKATLIPGQPLHFQCQVVDNPAAQFFWYKKHLTDDPREHVLIPGTDDNIEIHNDKLTLHKATRELVGDYYCRALGEENKELEFAIIRARMQPYIDDFGLDTSHTGKSSIVTEGERLELLCRVPDESAPVNITWLRSETPDDERSMVELVESPSPDLTTTTAPPGHMANDPFVQTFSTADHQNVIIERLGSHSKRLIIESVRHEHRSYYVCMADNGITERTRKVIFIRVKDRLVALWPFLGIVAELFILFTIIHIWETQRAYKEIRSTNAARNALLQ